MAGKVSTGLTGLLVEAKPIEKLTRIYNNILKTVATMPENAGYRKYTEQMAKQRLEVISSTQDADVLETKLNAGQLEEVIKEAKAELFLARRMNNWKPWEYSAAEPPQGQWNWP